MALLTFLRKGDDAVSRFPSILQNDAVTACEMHTLKVYGLQAKFARCKDFFCNAGDTAMEFDLELLQG